MKLGLNVLVAGHCPPEGSWSSVLRAMGASMVEQRGYAPLLVQVSLEEVLASPTQPRIFGDCLAVADAQMLGLGHPLVVVTVLEAREGSRAAFQPRHVLLRVFPSIPSELDAKWIETLTSCLEDSDLLRELTETKTPLAFGVALQKALRSDSLGRNASNGVVQGDTCE